MDRNDSVDSLNINRLFTMKKFQLSYAIFGFFYCVITTCLFLIDELSTFSYVLGMLAGVCFVVLGLSSYFSKKEPLLKTNPKLTKAFLISSFVLAILVFIFFLLR